MKQFQKDGDSLVDLAITYSSVLVMMFYLHVWNFARLLSVRFSSCLEKYYLCMEEVLHILLLFSAYFALNIG